MNTSENNTPSQEEFYASLKEKLETAHNFPEDYLFKFIVESDPMKLTEIYRAFDGIEHAINNRDSKNGKYTSLSINAFVLDADMVINIYKKVSKTEGVVML